MRWYLFVLQGIGWFFNKLFPHTELFDDFVWRSIETGGDHKTCLDTLFSWPCVCFLGLITAWQQRTWADMRTEYLTSGEERIVLPEEPSGGQQWWQHNVQYKVVCRETSCIRWHSGRFLSARIWIHLYFHCPSVSDSKSKMLLLNKTNTHKMLKS